jgi:HAMP domain-containing protein/putative methionine-R-sulfoxide reductase with GAF domain
MLEALVKLLTRIKNSLKAKVAMFFVVFAVLIVVEMIILSVLRKKALAMPKQIELSLDALYFSQEARLSFQQYLSQTKDHEEALKFSGKSQALLDVLLRGGKVNSAGFQFAPIEGATRTSVEKLTELMSQQRATMIDIMAKQKFLATYSPPVDTLGQPDSLALAQFAFQRQLTDFQSFGVNLKAEFDHLMELLKVEMGQRQSVIAVLMAVVVILDVGVLGLFFLFMSRNISNPLKEIADAAANQRFSTTQKTDEIGIVASNLNNIISQLNEANVFIKAIGEGQLDAKLKSDNENAGLSQALLNMQGKLRAINEEEDKRKWANEGLAKFVEIIRSGESNVAALGDIIIKTLVSYTGATQGGLYVWNDDHTEDQYLELVSAYAFNRKKFEEKKIKAGEGLLGQAYLEQLTTQLTEIPPDYFRMVSGLGEMDPYAILIVPLVSDGKVYGLVELASLKEFKDHEIAFVEKLGETLASTLSSVKTNERNRKLLEDFQQQTESMRSQEEEMRQNMEELTATQEEMARKEQGYLTQIQELQEKIVQLHETLKQSSTDGEWQIAHQANEMLQTNLKALEVSLQTLRKSN